MTLRGRGLNYTRARGLAEALCERIWWRDWPARLSLGQARPRRVDYELELPEMAAGAEPLRVGFASDLHAGPTTASAQIEQAFELLGDFHPDLLLLGGDYVFASTRHAAGLVGAIRSVEARLGRFAVWGNHDLWADDRLLERRLGEAGVELLVNRTVRLAARPEVSVGGLDDAWAGRPDYRAGFVDPAPVHLLLMHGPEHIPRLAGRRFSLALCGHTHGGQIAWPNGVPILAPSRLSKRYHFGRFDLPGGPLLVSRGVGNVEVPLRLFAPPDVLCVTLLPASGRL